MNEEENNNKEAKEDIEFLKDDVALTCEEQKEIMQQEIMQHQDDFGNTEQPLRAQNIQSEAAEAVKEILTMAPRVCIGLNSLHVEQFAQTNFLYCAKFWSHCRGWRSQTCELSLIPQVADDDSKQCRSCVSAKKNIKCDWHPLLFTANENDLHSASLVATAASLRDYILKLFESNKENVSSGGEHREKMRSAATALIALKEHSPLQLGVSTIYGNNTTPSSHCNLRWMTKEELAERYNKLKKENFRVASNLKKLSKEISSKTKHENLCLTEESHNIFISAINIANSEQGMKMIKQTLMNLLTNGDASTTQEAEASCLEFVDAIAEEMTAFSTKLNSGDKQVRFSPRVLRVTLSMYLKSPKTYSEFKSSSVLCLPSISTLKKLKQSRSVNDGVDLKIYERHKEQRNDECEVGHLICDEMKLVEGLLWNTSTHEVQGFACDDINDLASLLKRFSTEDETEEIATSVNQWRFRSVLGKIFNCEFFSNRGALNGDNLLLQFIHVVLACEAIRWKFGVSYAMQVEIMQGFLSFCAIETSEEPWLPAEMVTTTNPFDPSRKIAIWHCVTHVLKALRNAFHSSMLNKTRNFIDAAGNPFGFQFIVDALHRDELRAVAKTDLSKKSVYIEGWSAMNVAAAKSVFSERTITEGITYVRGKLKTTTAVSTIKASESEYTIAACHKENLRHGLFYGAVRELKEKAVDSNATIKSELASLEYMAVVGALFNELLMNRNEKITLANIDARMTYKFYLRYFHDWSESSKSRKTAGDKKVWQKYFIIRNLAKPQDLYHRISYLQCKCAEPNETDAISKRRRNICASSL